MHKAQIAYWFNVPALIGQIFLLTTFAVLPSEKRHGHYLSVGLCVSMVMLELAFVIPLGTKPSSCYNDITPNDMHSDLSCAWSGALLEAGALAATVWSKSRPAMISRTTGADEECYGSPPSLALDQSPRLLGRAPHEQKHLARAPFRLGHSGSVPYDLAFRDRRKLPSGLDLYP